LNTAIQGIFIWIKVKKIPSRILLFSKSFYKCFYPQIGKRHWDFQIPGIVVSWQIESFSRVASYDTNFYLTISTLPLDGLADSVLLGLARHEGSKISFW